MLEKIFGSKTRTKLLILFLSNPGRWFHIRGLCRKLNLELNSVRRELLNLKKIALLVNKYEGKKRLFRLNENFPIFPELKEIVLKMGGGKEEEDGLKANLAKLGQVKLALIAGVFLKKESPVDLFLVGEVSKNKLKDFVADLEGGTGKEINYTQMSEEEFHLRQACHDRFLGEIFSKPHQVLIDKLNLEEEKK